MLAGMEGACLLALHLVGVFYLSIGQAGDLGRALLGAGALVVSVALAMAVACRLGRLVRLHLFDAAHFARHCPLGKWWSFTQCSPCPCHIGACALGGPCTCSILWVGPLCVFGCTLGKPDFMGAAS